MKSGPRPLITWIVVACAGALFVPLFATRGFGAFDFWWWMSTNALILLLISAGTDAGWRSGLREDLAKGLWWKILLGVGSAALLYGVFFGGNLLSRVVLEFAGGDIDRVYAFKDGASVVRVGLLIGLLIGPVEELFWRGYLQRRLEDGHGKVAGLLMATAVYAGVHVASLNLMLIVAAGVCGLFWGILYMRFRSVTLNVVSHVLWDLAVFVWFPFS